MRRQQSGFTLVELVVVIIILGILAATALPRFMNVTTKAHKSAVDGAAGGLGAGVAMLHAQWMANGETGAKADITGFGDDTVDANATGWPAGTGGTTLVDAADCVEVWNGVMQNPPTIATSGTATDYTAALASGVCTYTYTRDTTTRSITYNSANGSIAITNPDA